MIRLANDQGAGTIGLADICVGNVRRKDTGMRKVCRFGLLLTIGLFSRVGQAATIIDFTFEDDGVTPLLNGQAIDQNEEFGVLFDILSSGPNAGAAIFDSTPGVNPADPDLWVGLGNVLILQTDNGGNGAMTGDFFDNPNDEADGINTLFFNFFQPVALHAIDLIDVDQNGPVTVTLTDGMGRSRIYHVAANWTYEVNDNNLPMGGKGFDTLDLTSLADQVGEGGGVATATQDNGFDANDVLHLTVAMDGSGAIDNLVFVPEPASALLLVAGALLLRRRRVAISA